MKTTKAFFAGGGIAAYRFVKPTAVAGQVIQAASPTDVILGVSTIVGAATAEHVDVVLGGIAEVELGGTVAAGAFLTSDGSGKAVTAAPAAGVNMRYGAMALYPGANGDIAQVYVTQGSVQG